jgi:hypothetical protein
MAKALVVVAARSQKSTMAHNFRQEYVTPKRISKPTDRHTGNIVIKILQFPSTSLGCAVCGHRFNPSNQRHARVRTRTTAP